MSKYFRSLTLAFSIFAVGVPFLLADETDEAQIMVQPEPEAAEVETAPVDKAKVPEVTVGTKLYDAATVGELYQAYEKENKRRAAELAPHLNSDALDVIELGPVQAEANHIRNLKALADKIDPQPMRRLQRLAELDPEAAADLRVTMRSEERFFAGELDATNDMNAGRTANIDAIKAVASAGEALNRAKKAMQPKRVTDDQKEVSSDEK